MTPVSSSGSFFDDPFLNDSFFAIPDLFNAAIHVRKRKENWETSNDTGSLESKREMIFIPRMDLYESKVRNEITIILELPGMKKEDVVIDIQQNRLTVSGRNAISTEIVKEEYRLRERRLGRFVRTIAVPNGLKPRNLKTRMENGVLMIRFPRTIADQTAQKRFKLKDLAKL